MHALRATSTLRFCRGIRSFSTPKCQIGLYGVLEDRNSSHLLGPAKAPPIIRKMFNDNQYNGHSEYGHNIRGGNYLVDYGDIEIPKHTHEELMVRVDQVMTKILKVHGILLQASPPTMHAIMTYMAARNLQKGHIPLGLGGDHSVTYPLAKALRKHYDRPFSIVHFDAHPDIYHAFEGQPYSHASPFARIMESTNPVICDKLLQIGIRTATPHQREQMRKFKSKTVDAKDFPANGGEMKYIFDTYLQDDSLVYLSVDLDCLDPAFAPGVSHRECGGLSTRQLLDAIFAIPGRIIGADIVEYNPDTDVNLLTAATASKLMLEIAGKIVHSNTAGTPLKP